MLILAMWTALSRTRAVTPHARTTPDGLAGARA
jgi:hypothetical protein